MGVKGVSAALAHHAREDKNGREKKHTRGDSKIIRARDQFVRDSHTLPHDRSKLTSGRLPHEK